MGRRILDHRGGVVSEFHYDESTDVSYVKRVQDVEPILEANKRVITQGGDGYTPSRDMKHVASIPDVIYEEWQKEFCRIECIPHFGKRDRHRWKKFLKLKLNDSDNRAWRTAEGRV